MRLVFWTLCLSLLAGLVWLAVVSAIISICLPNVPTFAAWGFAFGAYASAAMFLEVAKHAPSTWRRG